jgi:hypothetical protein
MKRNLSGTKMVSMRQAEMMAMTITYILNFAAILKQVLDDGPNTYIYGNGRIA